MMRYQIGQEVWVMWADRQNGFLYPFYSMLMDFATVEKWPDVQFRKLTVTEHHRVRGDHDNNDMEPDYDGYVAVDEKGNVWHNQYPICHTGSQTRSGPNHIFNLTETCEDGQKLRKWFDANKRAPRGPSPVPASMANLTHELQDLRRNVHTLATGEGIIMDTAPEPELEKKLRAWLDHILDSFGRQTGLSVIEEPHPMPELRGWYNFTVEAAP